jgi:hypothetical protein
VAVDHGEEGFGLGFFSMFGDSFDIPDYTILKCVEDGEGKIQKSGASRPAR